MDTTFIGPSHTPWETPASWDNGLPGVNDRAIITWGDDDGTLPTPPVSATAIHDLRFIGGVSNTDFDASTTLTVSHDVEITGTQTIVRIKEQTNGAGTVTVTGTGLVVTDDIAGDVEASGSATVQATNFSGDNTVDTGCTITGNILGSLTIPAATNAPLNTVTFGAASTLTFTGASGAMLAFPPDPISDKGPHTFSAESTLVVYPSSNTTILFDGCTGTVGGSGIGFMRYSDGTGEPVSLDGATLIGSFQPDCVVFDGGGATGTPTTDGFAPLIKIGTDDPISTRDDGEIYRAPPANKIINDGTEWGTTDNPLIGTASAGAPIVLFGFFD